MKPAFFALLLVSMLATPDLANASNANWFVNATGCVPGDPAIQNHRYITSSGSVKHASGNADLITLYCPVTQTDYVATTNTLFVTYQDNDNTNTGTPTDVTVGLIAMNGATGAITTVTSLSSSSFAATSGATVNYVTFTHTWLPTANYYYLRVDIQRHSASSTCIGSSECTAVFYGALLAQM